MRLPPAMSDTTRATGAQRGPPTLRDAAGFAVLLAASRRLIGMELCAANVPPREAIERFEELAHDHAFDPISAGSDDVFAAASVLHFYHPGSKALPRLVAAAERAPQCAGVASCFLFGWAASRGESQRCQQLLDSGAVEPPADVPNLVQRTLYWRAFMHKLRAEYSAARLCLADAEVRLGAGAPAALRSAVIELKAKILLGLNELDALVHLHEAVFAERTQGDAAQRCLASVACSLALTAEDRSRAWMEASQLLQAPTTSGPDWNHLLHLVQVAQAAAANCDADAARYTLDQLKTQLDLTNWPAFAFSANMVQAELAPEPAPVLVSAFAHARCHGLHDVVADWLPSSMSRLCALALDHNVDPQFVQHLVLKRGLEPQGVDSELWPWALRIFTLGRFTVQRHGKVVGFGQRGVSKPQELLKALVALGGRDVSLATLAESMWPNSDGDQARNLLQTTLHRLRRVLGDVTLLQVADGRVSLDPRRCWVDAWAFESLSGRLSAQRYDFRPRVAALERYAERLLRLYRGEFLSGDDGGVAVLTCRERLRSKLLRAVAQLGDQLESCRAFSAAALLYQRGIEIDPLDESLCRRLMCCWESEGAIAAALNTYRRCREVLAGVLHVVPAQATQEIYQRLLRGTAKSE